MNLSVVAINAAEIRAETYGLGDRDGVYLLVTPSGGRYWRMNYRHYGKQKPWLSGFGPTPAWRLAGHDEEAPLASRFH